MADNFSVEPVTGTPVKTFASDDIAGIDWPYAKLAWGPRDTANEVDDVTGKRLPVSISSTVTTTEEGRASVLHGQASIASTVGGTQLPANACKSVTVKNLQSNAALIWIGISGVSAANGYELNPGESLTLQVSNTNLVYGLSPSGAQTLCFIATN